MSSSMLWRHLKWKGSSLNHKDNFMSWTSSLLFALQYMIYRYDHDRDHPWLVDVRLWVIDTTEFASGGLLRDVDLIEAYMPFDDRLEDLGGLRRRQHKKYSGYYCFGEYLSQGALRIKGECDVVTLQDLVVPLSFLQPEFKYSLFDEKSGCQLSNEVVRLREQFH